MYVCMYVYVYGIIAEVISPGFYHYHVSSQVVVIKNPECAQVWAKKLWESTLREDGVVGCDVEWKPTYKKGEKQSKASILQLSGPGELAASRSLRLVSTLN